MCQAELATGRAGQAVQDTQCKARQGKCAASGELIRLARTELWRQEWVESALTITESEFIVAGLSDGQPQPPKAILREAVLQ